MKLQSIAISFIAIYVCTIRNLNLTTSLYYPAQYLLYCFQAHFPIFVAVSFTVRWLIVDFYW